MRSKKSSMKYVVKTENKRYDNRTSVNQFNIASIFNVGELNKGVKLLF